jgi:hypothetical protein
MKTARSEESPFSRGLQSRIPNVSGRSDEESRHEVVVSLVIGHRRSLNLRGEPGQYRSGHRIAHREVQPPLRDRVSSTAIPALAIAATTKPPEPYSVMVLIAACLGLRVEEIGALPVARFREEDGLHPSRLDARRGQGNEVIAITDRSFAPAVHPARLHSVGRRRVTSAIVCWPPRGNSDLRMCSANLSPYYMRRTSSAC